MCGPLFAELIASVLFGMIVNFLLSEIAVVLTPMSRDELYL